MISPGPAKSRDGGREAKVQAESMAEALPASDREGTKTNAIPTVEASSLLSDPALSMISSLLNDVEGLRKAQANRLRIYTRDEADQDGLMRGFGLDDSHPVVRVLNGLQGSIESIEHDAVLALQRVIRKHPLGVWQRSTVGVGAKQLGRLLSAIGDPYINENTMQPRTVSQLWAYCGLHTIPGKDGDEAPKLQRGIRANWSNEARMRVYLIAQKCIMQRGTEYRELYENRRARTEWSHTDWSAGHSHNDALRLVSKRILRDLWRAAKRHHSPSTVKSRSRAREHRQSRANS